MRKWLFVLVIGALFIFPSFASAQADVKLTSMTVQLWPEYDQPSMLVITDFEVAADTQFPVSLTFRIPQGANLAAVAIPDTNGIFINVEHSELKEDGEWQSFTFTLETIKGHFEYYQPITFNGKQRIFSYLWDNKYEVDKFYISILEPLDTTLLTTTPKLVPSIKENEPKSYESASMKLATGEQFALNLTYEKSSDALIKPLQGVQPAAPVDENTTGRVSLSNYLPYVIGGLGVVMIVGGLVYYMQSGRGSGAKKSRRRQRASTEPEEGQSDIYCAQCGTRAHGGDRFCRTCGSRIRQQEE